VRPRKIHLIALTLLCLIGAIGPSPALGVIIGNEDFSAFTNSSSPYYGMTADYVYRYGTAGTDDTGRIGSIDAIGYFTLITARHFGPAVNDKFTLPNGDQFQVTNVQYPSPDTAGGNPPDMAVLTVANLTHPNRPLPGFYQIVTAFPRTTQTAVIVGAGHTGTIVGGVPTEDTSTPRIVRWGTNKITPHNPTVKSVAAPGYNYNTKCFDMQFNESGVSTDSTYGGGDSGGGVFFKEGTSNVWKLGGINLYKGSVWDGSHPDDPLAASLNSYSSWINGLLTNQKLPGDADGDNDVDIGDYFTLKENFGQTTGATWAQGDFNGDGAVNVADLGILEMNFGYNSPLYDPAKEGSPLTITPGGVMPEPATLALLAAGAAGLLLRRSCRNGRR
jgi:hypothetical protein